MGQFEFVEWTPDRHLRHSRFVGLRDEKKAYLWARHSREIFRPSWPIYKMPTIRQLDRQTLRRVPRVDWNCHMKRRFKTLAILSLACLAVVLSVGGCFNWYLKRNDDKLKKQLAMLTIADDQPSLLDVRVATPEVLLSVLETPEKFRIMYRVSDIPEFREDFSAFARATQKSTQEDVFSMAEPGAWPWSVGDAILDGLPRRRLKAVAVSESLCLVFYEHGGFAKSDDIAAFGLSGNGARAIWHSFLAPDVANPAGLRNAIRGQPYGDETVLTTPKTEGICCFAAQLSARTRPRFR